jgi:hypothetical protein
MCGISSLIFISFSAFLYLSFRFSPINSSITPSAQPTSISSLEITPESSEIPMPNVVVAFPIMLTGLTSTAQGYVLSARQICMLWNQELIWEPGDFWDTYFPPTRTTIDGQQTQFDTLDVGPTIYEFDNQHNIVGFHGNVFGVCVTPELEKGVDTVGITITSTSGKVYAYSWEFRVE